MVEEIYLKEDMDNGTALVTFDGDVKDIKKLRSYAKHMGDKPIIDEDKKNDKKENGDMVNHPDHYNNGGMECINEIRLVFGDEFAACFCLGNVWKYRYRAPYKENAEQDLKKANWYMNKYKEIVEDNMCYPCCCECEDIDCDNEYDEECYSDHDDEDICDDCYEECVYSFPFTAFRIR